MGHNPQHLRGPIRSAGITDTPDLARLQMAHLTFLGADLNAHSPSATMEPRARHANFLFFYQPLVSRSLSGHIESAEAITHP